MTSFTWGGHLFYPIITRKFQGHCKLDCQKTKILFGTRVSCWYLVNALKKTSIYKSIVNRW